MEEMTHDGRVLLRKGACELRNGNMHKVRNNEGAVVALDV